MPSTPSQLQQAIQKVVQKAATDAAFRARAIAEPIAVLNETGGLDLPLNTPIRFVDKQTEMVVPLPAFGSDPDEITDEEMLSSVSGGTSPVVWGTMIVATIVVTVVQVTNHPYD